MRTLSILASTLLALVALAACEPMDAPSLDHPYDDTEALVGEQHAALGSPPFPCLDYAVTEFEYPSCPAIVCSSGGVSVSWQTCERTCDLDRERNKAGICVVVSEDCNDWQCDECPTEC